MIPFYNTRFTLKEKFKLKRDFNKILNSGRITEGEYLERLEHEIFEITKKYAIGFSSGTASLYCSLQYAKNLGLKKAITTNLSWKSYLNVVQILGFEPIFIDVRKDGLMDLSNIPEEAEILYPTLIWGNIYFPSELTAIKKFQILDASHCTPFLDSFKLYSSEICCFSLHATKPVTAGEGGIAITSNPEIANFLRKIRRPRLNEENPTLKFLMDEFSAAVALRTLQNRKKRLRSLLETKKLYKEGISLLHECKSGITFFNIVVERRRRDKLIELAKKDNIELSVKYPLLKEEADTPNAKALSESIISLPFFPFMKFNEVEEVINFFRRNG